MVLSMFGGSKDVRRTAFPQGEQLIAVFGGVEVDLSQAPLAPDTYISALAFCGGVKLIVPRGTEVLFSGFAILGGRGYKQRDGEASRDHSARVHLNGVAILGGIEVVEV